MFPSLTTSSSTSSSVSSMSSSFSNQNQTPKFDSALCATLRPQYQTICNNNSICTQKLEQFCAQNINTPQDHEVQQNFIKCCQQQQCHLLTDQSEKLKCLEKCAQ